MRARAAGFSLRAQRTLTVASMAHFLNMKTHCNEEYQLDLSCLEDRRPRWALPDKR